MIDLSGYIDHFRARVLQDALAEATADYWLRRGAAFAAVGNPACDATAQACRNHAYLLTTGQLPAFAPDAIVAALIEAA